MKRLVTASILSCVGAFVACAVEEPAPVGGGNPNQGGTTAVGGVAGQGVSGGVAGQAAQGGTAGMAAQGGTAGVGQGGTPPVGGAAGQGGTPPVGGAAGQGAAGAGNVGGMTGGTAGGGAGGMTGGTAGGGAGGMTGGTAGAGGSGGMACPTPTTLFPMAQPIRADGQPNPAGTMGSFDGYTIQTPCAPTNCDDCGGGGWIYKGRSTGCNADGAGLNAVQRFPVGGVDGENYRVTVNIYAITEPKNYGNSVTRQAGATTRPMNQDSGATPPPFAYAVGNPNYTGSDYNTYEIHVVDHMGAEKCSYFLNSDTTEGHWTYVLNYSRIINVVGGGEVRVRVYDRNCRMIKNCMSQSEPQASCGNGRAECAAKAREIAIPGTASPQPDALDQPGLGQMDNEAGQWMFLDVTNVACGMQPNTTCAPY